MQPGGSVRRSGQHHVHFLPRPGRNGRVVHSDLGFNLLPDRFCGSEGVIADPPSRKEAQPGPSLIGNEREKQRDQREHADPRSPPLRGMGQKRRREMRPPPNIKFVPYRRERFSCCVQLTVRLPDHPGRRSGPGCGEVPAVRRPGCAFGRNALQNCTFRGAYQGSGTLAEIVVFQDRARTLIRAGRSLWFLFQRESGCPRARKHSLLEINFHVGLDALDAQHPVGSIEIDFWQDHL